MGKSISAALAREGVSSVLLGRSENSLSEAADICAKEGTPGVPLTFDISQINSIEKVVSEATGILGGLNFLINCAGIYEAGAAHEVDLDKWDKTLDINLRAHYYFIRFAAPKINKEPGGAIIKIGSVASSYPGGGMHLASTYAQNGYMNAVFEDVREYGTKVCVIRPGFVNTQMSRSDSLNSDLMIQPDDIAHTIIYILTMSGTGCPTEIVMLPQKSPYRTG
jgi:3-oxoacyl-[acyl-carrier protein] reductase